VKESGEYEEGTPHSSQKNRNSGGNILKMKYYQLTGNTDQGSPQMQEAKVR
jgi:hypothetical protein